jgi:hypothetical protein
MKARELIEERPRARQTGSTGTARRHPRVIGNQFAGYSLDDLIQRSEQVTEVMKHFLTFPIKLPKKT